VEESRSRKSDLLPGPSFRRPSRARIFSDPSVQNTQVCPGRHRLRLRRACESSPEVTSHSIVRTLNFSSADNAGVILARLSFLVPQSEGPFIERTERSPCLQSAWRTPTDGGAEPFFERSRPFRIFVLDLLPRRLLWSVGVHESWRRERGSWQPRWVPRKLASFS
jgi:hypothetical protein